MLQQLTAKHNTLSAELQKLHYEQVVTYNQQQQLEQKIKEDKSWLVNQPQRQDFVEKLQQYLQQQNVLAFNQMLSAFVEDVLEKDKKIELELYVSHNLPALKMHAKNNGESESIMEGSGGSLANIVSTGLRIIAVARSPARNFLVLDEADCWIKPERIELFAKVIGEISVKLNMQIVMISHHSAKHFENYGRVIELKKIGSKIEADIVSDTPMNGQTDYITRMRLQNFMSHDDTWIDFHPNITCIIGENDIGKSVIGAAFRAVGRANSEDGFIQHKKDFAAVTLDIDNQYQIYWQRNRKTSQEHKHKVFYDLIENSTLVAREYNANECPKFIAEKLNIEEIDSIDVHLAHQKEPTFLIDSKTRPQDKAKILSLGKESFIVQKMMEKIKEKDKSIKKQLVIDERDYYKNSLILKQLEDLAVEERCSDAIKEMIEQYRENLEKINKLQSLCTHLRATQTVAHLEALSILEDYQLENTFSLENLIRNYSLYQRVSQIESLHIHTTSYELQETHKIDRLIQELQQFQIIKDFDKLQLLNPDTYSLQDTQKVHYLIEEIKKLQATSQIEPVSTIDTSEYELIDTTALVSLRDKIKNYSIMSGLETLPTLTIPALSETEKLKLLIADMRSQEEKKELLLRKLENSKEYFAILEQEKEELHQQLNGLCPCCGNAATIDQLL